MGNSGKSGKLAVVGHPVPPGLRRAMGVIFVAALCASAVTFYQEAPGLPRSAPATAPATTGGTPLPPASPSPSSTTSPKPPRTIPATEAKLPRGPGNTEPGILLMASPLANGNFDVAEIVRLRDPTTSIRLAPHQLTLAGSRFAKNKPIASEVQVSAGDQPVMVPGGRVNKPLDISLTEPVKHIELRYNLSGVTLRSIPSPAGRALSTLGPLTAGVSKNFPVVLLVRGNTVLNIQCPGLRHVSNQACSTGRVPHLRAKGTLPWSSAVIVVQFDLPKPQ